MSFYNYLIDYSMEYVGTVEEPVTLAEAKNYCRVSTSADDALILDLITQARESVERVTGLCLIPRTVAVWFNNPAGGFQLPFGPVTYFLGLQDANGNTIAAESYSLVGGQYPSVLFPIWNGLKASYQSGFDCIPKDLKVAILDQIDYDYENRGADVERYDQSGVCQKAWRACQRYTRTSPIL
jgi:uncharacterized phiE125 gp8 family phage protein